MAKVLERTPESLLKCGVCGTLFRPSLQTHYVARNAETTGVSTIMAKQEATLYDAYDCPECGCQYIVQERKRTCPCDYGICDECDHPGEDESGLDFVGCVGCEHESLGVEEEPCVDCCRKNRSDYWTLKEE